MCLCVEREIEKESERQTERETERETDREREREREIHCIFGVVGMCVHESVRWACARTLSSWCAASVMLHESPNPDNASQLRDSERVGNATGPRRQATGPPWSGARVGVGMLRGAGDSLT